MPTPDWQTNYKTEIDQAKNARALGNEGMARVCARRAAGIVIGEYLLLQGISSPSASAYDRLRILAGLSDLPEDLQESTRRLLLRVNTNHQLPAEADLISDAERLRARLLPD